MFLGASVAHLVEHVLRLCPNCSGLGSNPAWTLCVLCSPLSRLFSSSSCKLRCFFLSFVGVRTAWLNTTWMDDQVRFWFLTFWADYEKTDELLIWAWWQNLPRHLMTTETLLWLCFCTFTRHKPTIPNKLCLNDTFQLALRAGGCFYPCWKSLMKDAKFISALKMFPIHEPTLCGLLVSILNLNVSMHLVLVGVFACLLEALVSVIQK